VIITELLTVLVLLNSKDKSKDINCKITDVATCKAIKKVFLHINCAILPKYNYETAKARALCEISDERAGQHGGNPADSDRLGDVY
jgi:hypothetical protein